MTIQMNVKKWIQSSLRAKLLTMFVILTTIPLIAEGMVSYVKSYNTVSNHSIASTALVAEQLKRDIDILFQDTKKFLEIAKNTNVSHFLITQSETYKDAKEILNTFSLYRETYKFNDRILNISIVNMYGKGISEKKGVYQMDVDPLKNPHFLSLLNNPDEVLTIPPLSASKYDQMDHSTYDGRKVISIAAAVTQRITHEIIGFIVIDIDDSVVEDFCNNTKIGETGFFYVVDERRHPIFTPQRMSENSAMLNMNFQVIMSNEKGSYIDNTFPKPMFTVFTLSEMTGWKIIGQVPMREIMSDANEIKNLIFISVAISTIFAFTLYFFITSRLIRPIQYLKNKMRQAASGNLDAKAKSAGSDEIADLGNSFNIMLEKVKMLLEKSVEEQEHIKKAELRTLQAQINPHFLYNTLDSIVWMAEAKKSEQVIDLVKALSHFFRLSLSKGKDRITIKDELEHVTNYLIIQKMRYRDILDYSIEINEQILHFPILKMTLQPIVENALYHGIKNKRGKGLIQIIGDFSDDGRISLQIIDNGIGMHEEKLAELSEQLDKSFPDMETNEGGFGLSNVHQRIRLYYGEPYGVTIESAYSIGTRISMFIPAEERK
jgi:two-component system sensor histidine kinase YesM